MPRQAFRGPQHPYLEVMSALYRRNPVAFVIEQLGQEPTDYQKEVLNACADLNNKNMIICAARGSGKTILVSWIVSWSEACLIDFFGRYECVILGGSQDQSDVMHKYFKQNLETTPMLHGRLAGDPGKIETPLINGYVRALACSEKQVRGRHIELLILDEAAGIEDSVLFSALPQVNSSRHGRIIMLSTPHVSGGLFQDIWDNHTQMGYLKFGPWSMEDCPWFPQDELERARLLYPKERFEVEYLGMFPRMGGRVFDPVDIDKCTAKEPFKLSSKYDTEAGIDWGYHNPTVLIFSQQIKDKIYIPGPELDWREISLPRVNEQITKILKERRVQMTYADDSHMGENDRIADEGIACEGVKFSLQSKAMMRENAATMLYQGKIVISPDHRTLLKQLRKYTIKPVRGAEKGTRGIKKDEDFVDAFMLSLWTYAQSGGYISDIREHQNRFQAF